MRLQVEASLTYDFANPCEVLLLVEAARTPEQKVLSEALTVCPPANLTRIDDPITGERRTVLAAAGRMTALYCAHIEVVRRPEDLLQAPAMAIRDLPSEALAYLRPSRYCPSDRFEAFVARRFRSLTGGRLVASVLAWIADHVEYRPGASHAATTAIETFVDRAGVCRDFAHLAISLCRAADIPARAVSAYAWGLEPPDLHAVVEVYLGGGWRLIDPTGKAPVTGLARVATGRDAADIAFMTIFGTAALAEQRFRVDRLDG